MEKINRLNIADHLLKYQLDMVGKTVEEALQEPEWYTKWTLTREQYEEFRKYAIPLLKRLFHFNKAKAEHTFGFFDLQYGLKILDDEL